MLRPGKTPFFVLALLSLSAAVPALELEDCRISAGEAFPSLKARCGTLTRPENPEDPDSPAITLRVAVVPALNLEPMPDPVVPIAGGPGQGTIEFYAGTSGAFEPLRRDRDILLVDQRGTGDSSRMSCPVDDDFADTTLSTEEIAAYSTECLEALPHDPRYFTTSVAVSDLEAVREALGYPALNLYGISYGSRVAQHYARRYPATTRTVVLDGVVPPQLPLGPEIATESQAAIDRIFARCAEDPDCNEHFPDLAARFDAIGGLSDHTLGPEVPIAAVALGAQVIEKHFTLRRADGGPDSAFSLEPEELKQLCDSCRTTWRALGEVDYGRKPSEEANATFRRSLYVVEDIAAGQAFTDKNLRAIRPGHGLPPKHARELLGRTAKRDIKRGTPMRWDLAD